MRILTISIIFYFSCYMSFGQDIIISFSANGASSNIDFVKVENITQRTEIITTDNFINLSIETTANDEISFLQNNSAYPNPFVNYTTIKFEIIEDENVNIQVFDALGECVQYKKQFLTKGLHLAKIQANAFGFYFVSINGENFKIFQKVVCVSSSFGYSDIQIIQKANTKKSDRELFYEVGDLLKFTAYSGDYSTVITDSPSSSKTLNFKFVACTDFEENNYPALTIGNQTWMAENLKSTKYSNGNNISESYAYENNSSNSDLYGRLYTWNAIMNGASGNNNNPSNVQGICPTGWHVPSESEWDELRDNLGGLETMGIELKEVGTEHWLEPNAGAEDNYGFSILPAGIRFEDAEFQYLNEGAFFWNCSDFEDLDGASGYSFSYNGEEGTYTWNMKVVAQSVRCVLD